MRGSSFIMFSVAVLMLMLFFYWLTMAYAHFFSRRGFNYYYREFYECGFRAVPDMSFMLDLQFSSLGLMFLMYDMEIVLLTPLVVNVVQLPLFASILIFVILLILSLSYWYEWEKYSLNWSTNT